MKHILLIILAIISSTFIVTDSFADTQAPDMVVREALGQMKAVGNPSPIVDFIDWEDAFSKLTEQKKSVMNVSSSEDLQEFYRKVLVSPAAEMTKVLRTQFQGKLEKLGNKEAEELLERIRSRAQQKEAEVKDKIANSVFSIVDTKIEGDAASVFVEQKYKGKTETDVLKLHRKEGKWYFASVPNGSIGK